MKKGRLDRNSDARHGRSHRSNSVRGVGSEEQEKTWTVVVVDVNNLKNGRKPVKLQKESPAGCAGEGKQSKGNYEKRKGRFKD